MKVFVEIILHTHYTRKGFFSRDKVLRFIPVSLSIYCSGYSYNVNFKSALKHKSSFDKKVSRSIINNYPVLSDKQIGRDICKFLGKYSSVENVGFVDVPYNTVTVFSSESVITSAIIQRLVSNNCKCKYMFEWVCIEDELNNIIDSMDAAEFGIGSDFVLILPEGTELTDEKKKVLFKSHVKFPMGYYKEAHEQLKYYRSVLDFIENWTKVK